MTATANGTSQIDLAWTDNSSDETGFKSESHFGDGIFAEIATLGANVTSYNNTGLGASTEHTYRVRATNGAGDSGYSNEASATTDAPPTLPADPANLTATANGSSQIDLAWDDNSSDETGFKIESHSGDGNFAEIATVGADVTSYNNTGLGASTEHTYRVRATNDAGDSGYSNEASATTDESTVDPNVNLALGKPADASNSAGSYPAENLTDGDDVSFWGTRDNGVDEWVSVGLEAAKTVGRAIIKWHTTRYAADFELQVSDDESSWITVFSGSGFEGAQEFTFAQTTANYIRVYMIGSNDGFYSIDELEIYAGPATAKVRGKAENLTVAVLPTAFALHQNYPNPFNPSTSVKFSLPQAERVTLKVFNLLGIEVATLANARFEAGVHTLHFDASRLPSGVYIYKMTAGTFTQTKRMLLMK